VSNWSRPITALRCPTGSISDRSISFIQTPIDPDRQPFSLIRLQHADIATKLSSEIEPR